MAKSLRSYLLTATFLPQIQVLCLALLAFSYVRSAAPDVFRLEAERFCLGWAEWPDLYELLVEEGRIWDFRDVFHAASECFNPDIASILFFGRALQGTLQEKLIDAWANDDENESTTLAQLAMVTSRTLFMPSTRTWPDWHQKASQSLVQEISTRHPAAMATRPVMRWMLLKAFDSSFSGTDPFAYLEYCPGYLIRGGWLRLPIYIPFEFELPGWFIPRNPSKSAKATAEATLKQAMRLRDYDTQSRCLELLIMLTPEDPSDLYEQLMDHEKSVMGNNFGYLYTLLSSYIHVCGDRDKETRLLTRLKQVDNWTEPNTLRDADLHFAKHQMERILTAKLDGPGTHHQPSLSPLRKGSMLFHPWLPEDALRFVEEIARSGAPRLPFQLSDPIKDGEIRHPRSRPRHSDPLMSGAVPARSRRRSISESDDELYIRRRIAKDDRGSDDDHVTAQATRLSASEELPDNLPEGTKVELVIGRNGKVTTRVFKYPDDRIIASTRRIVVPRSGNENLRRPTAETEHSSSDFSMLSTSSIKSKGD